MNDYIIFFWAIEKSTQSARCLRIKLLSLYTFVVDMFQLLPVSMFVMAEFQVQMYCCNNHLKRLNYVFEIACWKPKFTDIFLSFPGFSCNMITLKLTGASR